MVINIWSYANYIWSERNDHSSLPLWIILAVGVGVSCMINQKSYSGRSATIRFLSICVAITTTDHFGYRWLGPTWKSEITLNRITDFFFLFLLGWDIALFLEYVTRGVRVDYDRLDGELSSSKSKNTNNSASEEAAEDRQDDTDGSSLDGDKQRLIIGCFLGFWAAAGLAIWVLRMFIQLLIWIPWYELFFIEGNKKEGKHEDDSSTMTTFGWMLMVFVYCFVLALPFAVGQCQLDEEDEWRKSLQNDVEMGAVG